MADQKITQLTELVIPDFSQILPIVEDPSGTPVTKKITLANLIYGGWIPYSSIVPTRSVSDDPTYEITFASIDLTSILYAGMRIKFTQDNTVRYFIITKVALDGSDTDVTLYGGTDYNVEDTSSYAISALAFSYAKAPFGFPLDPVKWTETATDTNDRSDATPSTQPTYENLNAAHQLAIPIGAWHVGFQCALGGSESPAGAIQPYVALSTGNNNSSDASLKTFAYIASSTFAIWPIHLEKLTPINLTSKTTYYLNVAQGSGMSMTAVGLYGLTSPTKIWARCAYL